MRRMTILAVGLLVGCAGPQRQMAGWGFTAAGGTAVLYTLGMVAAVGEGYSGEVLGAQLGVAGAALIIGIVCLATGGPSEVEVQEQNRPVYHKDERAEQRQLDLKRRLEELEDRTEHRDRMSRQRQWERRRAREGQQRSKVPTSQPSIPKPPAKQMEDPE